jgi:hypothetical protein
LCPLMQKGIGRYKVVLQHIVPHHWSIDIVFLYKVNT